MKKENKIIGIDTTYLGIYHYKDYKQENPKILKRILELSKTIPSHDRSTVAGWQSNTEFYKEPCVANLGNFVNASIDDYIAKTSKVAKADSFAIVDLWANVCPKYSYHSRHNHPNSDISGAYYVKVPDSAPNLVFINPHGFFRHFRLGEGDARVTPEEGMLVLFDSGLEHEVEQNTSNESRVALSINCQLTKKI